MTREELEEEIRKIHDCDMSLYDMWKAVQLGIRYGFEKAHQGFRPRDNPDLKWYKSVEEVLAELDKEQAQDGD